MKRVFWLTHDEESYLLWPFRKKPHYEEISDAWKNESRNKDWLISFCTSSMIELGFKLPAGPKGIAKLTVEMKK